LQKRLLHAMMMLNALRSSPRYDVDAPSVSLSALFRSTFSKMDTQGKRERKKQRKRSHGENPSHHAKGRNANNADRRDDDGNAAIRQQKCDAAMTDPFPSRPTAPQKRRHSSEHYDSRESRSEGQPSRKRRAISDEQDQGSVDRMNQGRAPTSNLSMELAVRHEQSERRRQHHSRQSHSRRRGGNGKSRHRSSHHGQNRVREQSETSRQTLEWLSEPHVPVKVERKVLDVLILNRDESQMMYTHPKDRCNKIVACCGSLGIHLSQALSLRRHHIQQLNPGLTMQQLNLGRDKDIRYSAELFERAVDAFLRRSGIAFLTERQQRRNHKRGGPRPPTPDFMLKEQIRVRVTRSKGRGNVASKNEIIQERVNWIEAKMFYGASTIRNDDGKSAVGNILLTANKYTKLYGPGAMVFMYGCGEQLANQLRERGVVALDASPVDLSCVEAHQRTWCANNEGVILP
jgi:hypothetical protein